MSVTVAYSTSAIANGGRDGQSKTLDGKFAVTLATPKELGGDDNGNNPEQLFAAGYAACFLGAMKYVASQDTSFKIPGDTTVQANVGIGPRSDGGFGLVVSLDVSLPGYDVSQAEALFEKTHHVCPYSNATRGNLDVKTTLV